MKSKKRSYSNRKSVGDLDKFNEVQSIKVKDHDKEHDDTSENEYEYSLSS